ncbi:MAG: 2-C-methyl-D-erythritol 2,4-cyclodiphosphate synthase, partial [Mariprofundales bacterium]|nr:2-C-methyl-D-erythritol 2,4-cyclodiphosphate synthase [Mariprofundales bacterium]
MDTQEVGITMRIGQGFDVHQLALNRPLVLGGVTIPHSHGLAGHSDADVLIHALCDALLGAASLGDIGQHFPDSDASFAGIDSTKLLSHVMQLLRNQGWELNNIDATVIAQQPKLAPFITTMRSRLAQVLAVDTTQVNIKATTTERLGFCGRQEGIAAQAVALIQRCEKQERDDRTGGNRRQDR